MATPHPNNTSRKRRLSAEGEFVRPDVCIRGQLIWATEIIDASVRQTGPRPTSHVVPDASESSHQGTEVSPRMQLFNNLKASARFHPSHPERLHIGYRRSDMTDVWVSLQPLRPTVLPQFYHDHEGNMLSQEELESSLDWLDDFKLERFQRSSTAERETERRINIQCVILNCVDNKPIKPVLIVSSSKQPSDVPIHVYLRENWTVADLFRTLTTDSNPRFQQGETVSSIETKFLWDGRKQVLRNNNPEDWTIFWEALRRALKQKKRYLAENGCEIEMVLRVEKAA